MSDWNWLGVGILAVIGLAMFGLLAITLTEERAWREFFAVIALVVVIVGVLIGSVWLAFEA